MTYIPTLNEVRANALSAIAFKLQNSASLSKSAIAALRREYVATEAAIRNGGNGTVAL